MSQEQNNRAIEKRLVHDRTISIKTYETDRNTILLEGDLRDRNPLPWYSYISGTFRNPGFLHHITATMSIRLPDLAIVQADAHMKVVADDECRKVEQLIRSIEGMVILQKGFRRSLSRRLGGPQGCIHLTELITAMASAAPQGQWGYYNRLEEGALLRAPDFDPSLFLNSCRLWRENASFAQNMPRIREDIARRRREIDESRSRQAQ